jgi:hypothetical protein
VGQWHGGARPNAVASAVALHQAQQLSLSAHSTDCCRQYPWKQPWYTVLQYCCMFAGRRMACQRSTCPPPPPPPCPSSMDSTRVHESLQGSDRDPVSSGRRLPFDTRLHWQGGAVQIGTVTRPVPGPRMAMQHMDCLYVPAAAHASVPEHVVGPAMCPQPTAAHTLLVPPIPHNLAHATSQYKHRQHETGGIPLTWAIMALLLLQPATVPGACGHLLPD